MKRHNHDLRERSLDLAWSLWTGLGVPGQIDNHGDCAIDPEPLILFTAGLGDADPRLRDEAMDWCIRYGQFVSGARLKNFLARESDQLRTGFGEFAATLAKHSSLRWPGSTTAREHTPRMRPRVQAFTRPSQIVLRLRALMGVSARADIIQVFLDRPVAAFSAADLALEIGYSKRNVALALEALALGDILHSFRIRNQIHYRIPSYSLEGIRGLLNGQSTTNIPRRFPRWSSHLRVLSRILEVENRVEKFAPKVRTVEVAAVLRDLANDIREAGLPPAPVASLTDDFWSAFMRWSMEVAK